jgi:hypothetical protein
MNTETKTYRPINVIAKDIRADWKKVNYGAVPYLEAMETLFRMDDMYYEDSAKSIVVYFLANATTWRGEKAKAIKKELKDIFDIK